MFINSIPQYIQGVKNVKIDLQKIKVQLIDEFNRVMNLNGRDLSFCLRITYE